jgi:hypothetical protein
MSPKNAHDLTASERRRHDRKVWRTALLASVLLHLVVFFFWRMGPAPIPISPFAAAGPRAGDDQAAQGSMRALNLAAAVPQPLRIIPPPKPLEVKIEVKPIEFSPLAEMDPAKVIGDAPGNGQGAGLPNGKGRGDGGTAASGRYRLDPPMPRGMIIPPSDKSLKGTKVQVWVFVNERGNVVPDSTRLNPPTKDKSFNQRLIQEASQWVFRPATQGGKPVASWFPYTISM